MDNSPAVFAVTRSFQGGATFDSFDTAKFEKGVVDPIRKLLSTAPPELKGIAVVTCAELDSKYAEEVRLERNDRPWPNDDRMEKRAPTTHFLHKEFPKEIDAGMIIPILCTNWGLNAGSATAINAGIDVARARGADKVLVWSPEFDLTGHMVGEMLNHMDRYALRLVGYLREGWKERLQYQVPQNTCALWDMALLEATDGMNPACNGDGITTISTPEFGDVPLAGMEDFRTYLDVSKLLGEFEPWGMVGKDNPAVWDTSLYRPGTPEYDRNQKKIARQFLVMQEYVRCVFPERNPIEVFWQIARVASFA